MLLKLFVVVDLLIIRISGFHTHTPSKKKKNEIDEILDRIF